MTDKTRKVPIIVAIGLAMAIAGAAQAAIIYESTALVRPCGEAERQTGAIDEFFATVDSYTPQGQTLRITRLSDVVDEEGLLGGPAAGAYYQGPIVELPPGLTLSAAEGHPPLNSGLAGSTAVFADLQGELAGTSNLYYLGDPAYGSSERNRIQFAPTDVGTNAEDILVLRPVSFNYAGEAIEVRPNEKGVLEAGSMRFGFDPAGPNVYGFAMIFIDTETDGTTRIYNITAGGQTLPASYVVPAGADDNEYFVGFLSDTPLDFFDVSLGSINFWQTGGDGVLIDAQSVCFITGDEPFIPEPATATLLGAAGAILLLRRSRSKPAPPTPAPPSG